MKKLLQKVDLRQGEQVLLLLGVNYCALRSFIGRTRANQGARFINREWGILSQDIFRCIKTAIKLVILDINVSNGYGNKMHDSLVVIGKFSKKHLDLISERKKKTSKTKKSRITTKANSKSFD